MFLGRKTVLYFCPHQDDELLTMGINICSDVRKGKNVHIILCTNGSKSSVRKILNNGKRCSIHEGAHTYDLSIEEFIQARDREFIGSCTALGVEAANIHIPEKRDIDGFLSVNNAEEIIKHYYSIYGHNAVVCTISPNNGPSQHQDHKALGKAADHLLRQGIIKEVRFFIEPYHFGQIQDNPRLIPIAPTITTPSADIETAIRKAVRSYSIWDPAERRYAIGYHSVTSDFDNYLKALHCYSFVSWNPNKMTLSQRLIQQHKKWLKLQKQSQLFYSLSNCEQPDLGALGLIHIPAQETSSYADFCVRHNVPLTDKNLQRLTDGSSFWALVSSDEELLSSGWLAYKQHFYIGETDYGFDMRESKTAVLFDFNTKAEHRGNGYYGLLLQSIVHNAEGPDHFIIYTSPDNTSSAKGILKAGFQFDGMFSAADGSIKPYLRRAGFTSIMRKYQLYGLRVAP